MDMLLPDRVNSLWRSVECKAIAAEDAMREQEAMVEECRASWTNALLRNPGSTLAEDMVGELSEYFGDASRAQLERRCREATMRLRDEWQDAQPEDTGSITRFYDQSEDYLFDLMWWHTLQEDEGPLAYVVALDFAKGHGARRHLDFGSGVGSGSILFARHAVDTTLADISSTMLHFARWRLERRGIAARFIDLKTAALPDASFDLITAMDVFEHLTDPVAAVDQLSAALAPGGYLFGRFAAAPDENRPQHIVLDFRPTFERLTSLGFVEVWRDDWLWGHQVFQKPLQGPDAPEERAPLIV
jgi:mycofactocin glycosyltransferase